MLARRTFTGLGLALVFAIVLGLSHAAIYAAGGDLDSTFGSLGKVSTDYKKTYDEARAVAIQPDGKIVVVGNTLIGGRNNDFAVARYNPNGTLDTTFSEDGKLTRDRSGGDDGAYAVAIQPDGKIVAVGAVESPVNHSYLMGAARYNPNGSPDVSFGNGGLTNLIFNTTGNETTVGYGVAIQPDGRIVLAGYTTHDGDTNFALARLKPDGSVDNSFDGDGLVTTNFRDGKDEAHAVAIQADGKIVAVGTGEVGSAKYDFAMARYNQNGSLDRTFNGDGKLLDDYFGGDDSFNAVAIQPNGSIVTAGYTFVNQTANFNFVVARIFRRDGTFDQSFDVDGKQTVELGGDDEARGVAIQADGKIVAVGFAPVGGVNRFALVRFNPNGSLDASFGTNGVITTNFGGGVAIGNTVAIQRDGKIVVAGTTYMGATAYDIAVARYLPVSAPPTPVPIPTRTPTQTPTQPVLTPTSTSTPPTDSRFFAATGHSVGGLFLSYWETHGGLAQQGFPITEELQEKSGTDGNTYTMQYFERAVFEHHPENQPPFNVLLSLLGVFYYNEKYGGNAPNQHASTNNPRKFAETGKTIGGAFRKYWETHGGLAQQGFPISDEFQEKSDTDGKTYTVQYFQRAVFEFHPEFAGTPNEVLLSLLGVFYDKKKHGP